jgi:hypothetical protein
MMDSTDDWEARVEQDARALPYPPTPDIAARLRRRRSVVLPRIAPAAAALLVIIALLAVPEIRAQVITWLRIGSVDFMLTTMTPQAVFGEGNSLPSSVLDFPGETTLEDAQTHAGYPITLPDVLLLPDKVYLVQAAQPIVVLAWLDENGTVEASLHFLPPITYSLKMYDGSYEETEVNGQRALWLPDPHYVILRVDEGDYNTKTRFVTMHALVWASPSGFTYRLETSLPLNEALRIAESIP